jgi:hypothetical protein
LFAAVLWGSAKRRSGKKHFTEANEENKDS